MSAIKRLHAIRVRVVPKGTIQMEVSWNKVAFKISANTVTYQDFSFNIFFYRVYHPKYIKVMLNESHVIAAAVPERTAIGELYSVLQL